MSEGRRPLPSLLPRGVRGVLAFVLILAALVLADTLYLVGVRLAQLAGFSMGAGGTAISPLFQVALLGHSVLGVLLVVVTSVFVALHLPRVWRRRHPASLLSGAGTLGVCLLLLVSGLFIFTEASTRDHRWVWWVHVAGAAALPALYVAHRRVSVVRPAATWHRRFGWALVVFTLALGLGHAAISVPEAPESAVRGVSAAERLAMARYGTVPPGYASPGGPFYPSPARTVGGGLVDAGVLLGPGPVADSVVRAEVRERGFYASAGIGAESCVRCHPDVTEQWESSAHRFSSFNNPFYEASIELLRENRLRDNAWLTEHRRLTRDSTADGALQSRWCGACHDPVPLFTGTLAAGVDRRSVAAQAGITCLTCHGMRAVHDRTGNGNYLLRSGRVDPYLFDDAIEPGWRRMVHDAALRARPDAHREAMLPPLLTRPEHCGTCHKVSLRQPLNGYRWVRGQNEFDAWEDSGVSLEGAQTFYLPARRRVCQDCHMPPVPAERGDLAAEDGMVRSHRFLGSNTALPYIRGDTAALRRVEEFLRDEIVTVDLFGVRAEEGDTVRALNGPIRTAPGRELVLDVVVRNRGVGHAFPGGTLDSNEGWLEVRLLNDGRTIARSGGLDADGHLDPGAHVYRALFVDSAGRAIDRRNPQDIRATVFVNAIGPGAANLAHFRITAPEEPGRYLLDARLRWRKFNRGYSEFTFRRVPEAFGTHSSAPELPVTTMDSVAVELIVEPEGSTRDAGGRPASGGPDLGERTGGPGESGAGSAAWGRWNDYGIASMREGKTREARTAFSRVGELAPDRPDGPMNLARVALAEGDLETALARIEEARRRAPEDRRIDWLAGEVELADGRYADAAASYERSLAVFPRHRGSLLGLARALYLDGRFESALDPLDRLLTIDPESRPAWYHRMLILRGLGRTDAARDAEAMVEYLRVDEAAGRLTREIRASDPGVNAMAQDVRVHELRPTS